jgi:hypothetical protein
MVFLFLLKFAAQNTGKKNQLEVETFFYYNLAPKEPPFDCKQFHITYVI